MRPTLRSSGIARRALLSSLAVLPALSIPMLTVPARAQTATPAAALPSWNDTAPKKAIVAFVERVTKQGSPDFVPADERIATFDNDGTLWAEQPMYFQVRSAFDRVKALAPQHPEWKDKEPFGSLLKGDMKGALAGGDAAVLQIVAATHSGITTVEFDKIVRDWIATAKHPTTGRLYTEMVYQPMLELLTYCIIAEWADVESLAKARSEMIKTLDSFRDTLEDLGGGLGVTDPVSGPVVMALK